MCQPLAPVTSSVTLTESQIVGAGQAQDGTLYVVTTGKLGPRLFVAEDMQLIEQYVDGSGGDTLVMYEDAKGVQHVIEVEGSGADMHMGIATGPLPDKTFVIGSVGEELTLVDASAVLAMPAQNTQTFHIDYVGEASDGSYIVVTAPDHASSYDDYRLFLGQVEALQQQLVTEFDASLSGTRIINFTFNGSAVQFSYDPGGAMGSLTAGGVDESFVSAQSATDQVAPSGAVFECR